MKNLGVKLLLILYPLLTVAQTSLPEPLVSPEVLPDRRVTFRLRAPKASEAFVSGDWMEPGTKEAMRRGEHGEWSLTLGPLEPGLAIYTMTVDGVTTPDPVNPRIKLRASTSASLVDVPGAGDELWQPGDGPHGSVEVNWERSDVIGDTRAFYVYTPPGYTHDSGVRYPVLYLLHGNNDTAAGWTDVGKANFIIDNLVVRARAKPMILVMPWGHAAPYRGPQTNNTTLFERYLVNEVIPRVEAKYRVAAGRENRAIAGLSMGGGHALQIGLSHLDLFSAVGAFSFAVPSGFETRFKSLLDDPETTNRKLNQLWLGCGRQDPAFGRNHDLAMLLTSHGVRNTFEEIEGRHCFTVWRRLLGDLAPLLFQSTGAGPAAGR